MNNQQFISNRVQTKQDLLKTQVLQVTSQLLEAYEKGIESDNVQAREFIEQTKKLISDFENSQPCVYVYVEGGNIQGAAATCEMDFELYDKDNYDVDGEYRDGQTPKEWDKEIKKLTEDQVIKGIY